MTSTPPGWYDDGHGAQRWWDGVRWTEHAVTADAAPAVADATATAAPRAAADPYAAPGGYAEAPEAAPGGSAPSASATGLPPELAGNGTPVPPYAGGNPAYPGVYPESPPSGAFVAATEPKKSKTWIIWLVAGIVLLGLVITAAVLIPIFFLNLATAGTQPSGDDEQQAVAAVELYDEAWREVDCDKFLAATTEDFREDQELTDCASFEPAAQDFADSVENYTLTVTSIERDDDTITVNTSETYDSYYDENGEPVDPPVPFEDVYSYEVVSSGGGWAIDDAN